MSKRGEDNVIALHGRRRDRTINTQRGRHIVRKILVAGADNTTYRIIQEIARQAKSTTNAAKTFDQILDEIESPEYDLVIVVDNPPSIDALQIRKLLPYLAKHSKCKFMVLHDSPDWEMTAQMDDVRVDAHLATPCDPFTLKNAITSLLNIAS